MAILPSQAFPLSSLPTMPDKSAKPTVSSRALTEWTELIVAEWTLTTLHGDHTLENVNPLPWLNHKARVPSGPHNATRLRFEPLFTPTSYLNPGHKETKTNVPTAPTFSKRLSDALC